MPRVGDVGRADQARVVGQDDREPGLGDHGLAGRRQVQREAPVERGVDREQADVAGGVDLVDHHHPALAHRLHERRVHQRDLAAGAGDRHPFVAEEELVRGRAGLHLDEAVERRAAAVLDRAAALGPQPVGDRAGDLALARAGRADQAQEARARGVVHVEQRERERVDALAVQRRRVDALAVREDDRVARRLELERVGGEGVGGEVAFGGDVVELPQGSGDRAHGASPSSGSVGSTTLDESSRAAVLGRGDGTARPQSSGGPSRGPEWAVGHRRHG